MRDADAARKVAQYIRGLEQRIEKLEARLEATSSEADSEAEAAHRVRVRVLQREHEYRSAEQRLYHQRVAEDSLAFHARIAAEQRLLDTMIAQGLGRMALWPRLHPQRGVNAVIEGTINDGIRNAVAWLNRTNPEWQR